MTQNSAFGNKLQPIKMKHPSTNLEAYEFNLGHALQLRCTSDEQKSECGECESCILSVKLLPVKEWFGRAGDSTQKRFALGLVRRIHSVDLIKFIINLLKPLLRKDYTYSRSRANPSLSTDKATMSGNRALDPIQLEEDISNTWHFFQNSSYWTKSNFMLAILHWSETHLLYQIAMLAQTLLLSEEKAQVLDDDYETSSIAPSDYSWHTGSHPSLALTIQTSPCYSPIRTDPFILPKKKNKAKKTSRLSSPRSPRLLKSPKSPRSANSSKSPRSSSKSPTLRIKIPSPTSQTTDEYSPRTYDLGLPPSGPVLNNYRRPNSGWNYSDHVDTEMGIINDDASSIGSIDPTCMVVPTSSKAHLGVSRYKDIIRHLPVYLSKKILGLLDKNSLSNAQRVTEPWKVLVVQVQADIQVNKRLKDDVALMQGASSMGCNPRYAQDIDVTVPNVKPNTHECIPEELDPTDSDHVSDDEYDDDEEEDIRKTASQSNGSSSGVADGMQGAGFKAAYKGYSSRKIIMESRNIYCGAYNVMVVIDKLEGSRSVDTNDGELVVYGGQGRRVKLVDAATSKELDVQCIGHAGSIRCVLLCQEGGFVLSGSYDTSIRKWSLETGKCMGNLRGHRCTVICMQLWGQDMLVSGGKDNLVKVWTLTNGKCIATFKHNAPIAAVAMNDELVISGCVSGKVKVWDLTTRDLVKTLLGHRAAITSVAFDKWHIVTGSRDGYVLCWSAQGDFDKCLNALRHPREVLCLAMSYLRVITGSTDGKLRIWNMVNGHCLRIIRGNSRSDPITQLIASPNKITINTCANTVVYNFEAVEYEYNKPLDEPPPRVQYSTYGEVPVRKQVYPYVRAQRMARAGATNPKIIHHKEMEDGGDDRSRSRSFQTPHSAKSLSDKTMDQAAKIQRAASASLTRRKIMRSPPRSSNLHSNSMCELGRPGTAGGTSKASKRSRGSRRGGGGSPTSAGTTRTRSGAQQRTTTAMSKTSSNKSPTMMSHAGESVVGGVNHKKEVKICEDTTDAPDTEYADYERRVSWANGHPHPFTAPTTGAELDLAATKNLLRSQIRAKGKQMPPDFVYLTVNSIQQSMKTPDVGEEEAKRSYYTNAEERSKAFGRPSSSPSKVDPRRKIPLTELQWAQLLNKKEEILEEEEVGGDDEHQEIELVPVQTRILTEFEPVPIEAKPYLSMHSMKTKSTIPPPKLFRPHTAAVVNSENAYVPPGSLKIRSKVRPTHSAPSRKSMSAMSRVSDQHDRNGTAAASSSHSQRPPSSWHAQRPISGQNSTAAAATAPSPASSFLHPDSDMGPMLMYSKQVFETIDKMKERRAERISNQNKELLNDHPRATGSTSKFNDPMRSHSDFKLKTHQQVQQEMDQMEEIYRKDRERKDAQQEKKQRSAWQAKVTGKTKKDFAQRPVLNAKEMCG